MVFLHDNNGHAWVLRDADTTYLSYRYCDPCILKLNPGRIYRNLGSFVLLGMGSLNLPIEDSMNPVKPRVLYIFLYDNAIMHFSVFVNS